MIFRIDYETATEDGLLLRLALLTACCCSEAAIAKARRRCTNAFRLIGWQALPREPDRADILVYDEEEVVHRIEEQAQWLQH